MEVARLEAIYTADDSDLRRVSARVEASFRHTAAEALKIENRIKQAFRKPHLYAETAEAFTTIDRRVTGLSGSMTSLSSVAAGVFAGFTISSVVSELQQAAAAVLSFKSNLQSSEIAFTTMLGNVDLAQQHLKDLQRFALTTPFEFEGLVDASKRMQAMGFEARQVIPILTDVGNAVAAVGGRRDVLDRVILAISQIQAKGRVAAQEMNQLAEAGIPAWRILSEQLGKSRAETIQLAEQGKISGKVFLDAFQKFSQANFGGMMERQSRTFAGAMSNIKDTLLQTAGTAFDPLFQQISQITDRMSLEMQTGKPDVERSFRILLDGLVEMAGAAGGSIADALISKITDPRRWAIAQDDPFFLDRFLRGFVGAIPDPEELFGIGDVSSQIPALRLPDLRSPLPQLTTQQKQNSEAVKQATSLYEDLVLKLAFYGQNTERATAQQRLLAVGMEALTSAEGRQAIQLATLIDKQRIAMALADSQRQLTEDLAAATESKYKTALESLSDATQSAVIEALDLQAAERGGLSALQRFNLGLGAQIQGLLDNARASGFSSEQIQILSNALSTARTATIGLTAAQEANKRSAERMRLGEQRSGLLRSLAGMDVELIRQLRQIPSDDIQNLAEQLEGLSFLQIRPGGLDLFVEKLRAGSLDAQTAIAEVRTALSAAAGDLGTELPAVTSRIVNLFLKAKELSDFMSREQATERYAEAMLALQDAIRGDIQLTHAQQIEKLLLTSAYKNLTEAQIESLRNLALEADIAEQLREQEALRIQTMREVAEDIGAIFGDVFDSIRGDWSDMWRDLSRIAQNISRQIMQELITGLFSKLFNVPFTSRAGGIVGLFTNGLFSPQTSIGGLGSAFGGARALGGPVEAGRLYEVNERGREFFQPNIGGQIIPLGQQSQQSSEPWRVAFVDDMRDAHEWRANEIHRLRKGGRKLGKLIPGY